MKCPAMKQRCIGHLTAWRRKRESRDVYWLSNWPRAFLLAILASVGWSSIGYAQILGTRVEATSCSSAIGGTVTASNVSVSVVCGIPTEKVDELVRDAKRPLEELNTQQRENIALLKEKLDLNLGQVRAALATLGEYDIPPERLAAKLVEIAERFKDLQATASAQPGDDPKIAALKTDAQKAIEAGELAKADALLAEVETEQRRARDRRAVSEAETPAKRGEIALARLRYTEAAAHFAKAAAVFPPNSAHEVKRISYLQKEADALYQQGDEFGDNGALLSAIERYKRLVDLVRRERAPSPRVDAVQPGSAAEAAGFQPGDLVLTIDRRPVESFTDMQQIVSTSAGETLVFEIDRGGVKVTLKAIPTLRESKDRFGNVHRIGVLGITRSPSPEDTHFQPVGPAKALELGVQRTWFVVERTLSYIGGVISGREAADQLGGPIRIAQVSGQVATEGLPSLFSLAAVLSVSIGLLNLFPVPLLDGGHLLFYGIEAARGRPLSERAQEVGFRIGLAIVVMLMIFATYNDLLHLAAQWTAS